MLLKYLGQKSIFLLLSWRNGNQLIFTTAVLFIALTKALHGFSPVSQIILKSWEVPQKQSKNDDVCLLLTKKKKIYDDD